MNRMSNDTNNIEVVFLNILTPLVYIICYNYITYLLQNQIDPLRFTKVNNANKNAFIYLVPMMDRIVQVWAGLCKWSFHFNHYKVYIKEKSNKRQREQEDKGFWGCPEALMPVNLKF